jgi:hypothetical protein
MSSKRQLKGIVSETKGTVIIVYAREKQTDGKHSQKARSYGRATMTRRNADSLDISTLLARRKQGLERQGRNLMGRKASSCFPMA